MVNRAFQAIDRNGALVEFELKVPGLAEDNEGDRQYRVAYSRALREGIFPREKLREIMREHEMWTSEDDTAMKRVVGQIAVFQIELKNAETEGDDKKCQIVAQEMAEARRRMWEMFLVQQSVYMNSAEGVAELIKVDAIMASCVMIKGTNTRYWKDYSEYVKERDLNMKSTVYSKAAEVQMALLDEVRQGIFAEYAEAKYLRTAQERTVDREIEEQVAKTLHERIEKALDKSKPPKKRKKHGEVASKTDKS
jgi:hypothetical protein